MSSHHSVEKHMKQYLRYEVVSIEGFLPDIYDNWASMDTKVPMLGGKWVGCTSLRLKTFARHAHHYGGVIECVACGLKATHFAVESCRGQVSPHMNLYGKRNGEDILFTHDHILARALGGEDNLSNTQVMCSPCNNRKSRQEAREVELRRASAKSLKAP